MIWDLLWLLNNGSSTLLAGPFGPWNHQYHCQELIPTWTNGLHAVQLELVSAILDGKDVLCCTATGNGKSAAFSVPTLVLSEYNQHPEVYVAGFAILSGCRWNDVLRFEFKNLSGLEIYKISITHNLKDNNFNTYLYLWGVTILFPRANHRPLFQHGRCPSHSETFQKHALACFFLLTRIYYLHAFHIMLTIPISCPTISFHAYPSLFTHCFSYTLHACSALFTYTCHMLSILWPCFS